MKTLTTTILVIILLAFSCIDKEQKKDIRYINVDKESQNVKLLPHPLIFEELGLKILDFESIELRDDEFEISITVETIDIGKYSQNHYFFIHAFDIQRDYLDSFINFDTKEIKKEGTLLKFMRRLKTNVYDYEEFRFGLVNMKTNERYFTRSLKEVSIKK